MVALQRLFNLMELSKLSPELPKTTNTARPPLFFFITICLGGDEGCFRNSPGWQRKDRTMDEDVLNMEIRKFLKMVGITSQREIEAAVRAALQDKRLQGSKTITAKITLTIDSLGLSKNMEGDIDLG